MSFGITASSYTDPALWTRSDYPNQVLAESPLLYWRLNDTSGTTAIDSSGNGRNGTYVNAPSHNEIPLLTHNDTPSTYFSSSPFQTASLASSAWMNVSELTITALTYIDPGGLGRRTIASRHDTGSTDVSFALYNDADGVFKFDYRGSGGQDVSIVSGVVVEIGHYYFVAAYAGAAGAGIRVYDYTGLVGSATGSAYAINASTRPFIAGGADQPQYWMTGYLQEVAFYDSILPTATLDAHGALAVGAQPLWINRVAGVAARNGTSSHTLNFTPATAGSLLIAVTSGSVTSTPVTAGWTQQLSAIFSCESAIFTHTATGGESSLQLTHNGSNYPIHYAIYEFPAGSTYHSGAKTDNGDTPALTGLPGTPITVFAATGQMSDSPSDPPGASANWGFGWVEDFDQITISDGVTDGIFTTIGYRDYHTRTTIDPGNDGWYGTVYQPIDLIDNKSSITFAIKVPVP